MIKNIFIYFQDDYQFTTRIIHAPNWPHNCEGLKLTFDLVNVVKNWHASNQAEEGPIVVIDKYVFVICCLFI